MSEKSSPIVRCSHYERNDWLKVDVNTLLAPWVDRVAEIYRIRKTPAKYLVTYALAMVAAPKAQEIMDVISATLDDPETFQKRYGTRLGPVRPKTSILTNPQGLQPAAPRQVNFMDLVDFWAVPMNRTFGTGINPCRDVVKIALTFFMADHFYPLVLAIKELVNTPPDHEFFSGEGKFTFPELNLICSDKARPGC